MSLTTIKLDSDEPKKAIKQSKRRGCGLLGCAGFICLLVGLAVGVVFLVKKSIEDFTETYTATAPLTFPKVEMPPVEIVQLKEKVSAFSENFKKGEPASIRLTQNEVNAMIQQLDIIPELKDKVHIEIKDDGLKGQFSLPVSMIRDSKKISNLPGVGRLPLDRLMPGRFLNGELDLGLIKEPNGSPGAQLRSLQLNGVQPPKEIAEFLDPQRLKSMAQENGYGGFLQNLDQASIQDGILEIISSGKTP